MSYTGKMEPGGFYRLHKSVDHDGSITDPVTGEVSHPPSLTKQSFRDQCDINNILKQYKVTGQIQHISANAARGVYDDLPSDLDFQDALNLVLEAEKSFATLPSRVRARFSNDPQEFLAFSADPANAGELVELGLAQRRPDPEPEQIPPAPPPNNPG